MRRAVKKESVSHYKRNSRIRTKNSEKRKPKVSLIRILTVVAFCGVFIFSFLFYTWVHMEVVHINYEMAQAQTLESEYLEVNKKLKTEIATLKTPLRIKKLAKAELGLSAPEKDQVIIIK